MPLCRLAFCYRLRYDEIYAKRFRYVECIRSYIMIIPLKKYENIAEDKRKYSSIKNKLSYGSLTELSSVFEAPPGLCGRHRRRALAQVSWTVRPSRSVASSIVAGRHLPEGP